VSACGPVSHKDAERAYEEAKGGAKTDNKKEKKKK
jgi:hypothetical protein